MLAPETLIVPWDDWKPVHSWWRLCGLARSSNADVGVRPWRAGACRRRAGLSKCPPVCGVHLTSLCNAELAVLESVAAGGAGARCCAFEGRAPAPRPRGR